MTRGRRKMTDTMRRAVGRPPARRQNNAVGLQAEVAAPDRPEQLDDAGAEEWDRVMPFLIQSKRVARIDRQAIAAYCMAYSWWQQAARFLLVDECEMWGRTESGKPKPATIVKVFWRHAETTVKLARRFGMTARTRHLDHADTGRPALPDELHEIRGNPSKKQLRGEAALMLGSWDPGDVEPPPCLGFEGLAEFHRIVRQLEVTKLWTPLDLAAVSIGSGVWALSARAIAKMEEEDLECPDGDMSVEHPLTQIFRKCQDLLVLVWQDYGMTPLDRRRFRFSGEQKEEQRRIKLFIGGA